MARHCLAIMAAVVFRSASYVVTAIVAGVWIGSAAAKSAS